MHVIAIDVGMVNLGLVEVTLTEDYTLESVVHAERVNIMELQHRTVKREDCRLYHTADAVDRVQHFVQEQRVRLDRARHVLIERQPPTGLVHVEQLLYHFLREKAILLSPNPMHKHFKLPEGEENYPVRKMMTVEIARPHLETVNGWQTCSDRLHDMADALCFVLWWVAQKHAEWQSLERASQLRQILDERGHVTDVQTFFEQYRYVPP